MPLRLSSNGDSMASITQPPNAPGVAPIDAAAGLEAAGSAIQEGGDLPRKRQAIIAASAELQSASG
jgi:hypothetical protein